MRSARTRHRGTTGGAFPAEARLLGLHLLAGVSLFALARLAFVVCFADRLRQVSVTTALTAFVVGLQLDVSLLVWLLLPLWALCFLPGVHWAERPRVRAAIAAWTAGCAVLVVAGIVSDLLHFREFGVHLDATSLDYLRNPAHLLVVSYHEFALLPIVIVLAAIAWLVARQEKRLAARLAHVAARGVTRVVCATAALAALGSFAWWSVANAQAASCFSQSYAANQLAVNGPYNLAVAAVSEMADEAVVREMVRPTSPDEAWATVRGTVGGPGDSFADDPRNPLWRRTTSPVTARPLNVVVLLLEGFDARGIDALEGGGAGLSPNFDALARGGVLFSRHYAVGTRTNRGIAGVLSSLPSLPGCSPLRAPGAEEGVFTLARVLRGRGYGSVGVYGGDRHFDDMHAYLVRNGFDRLVALDEFEVRGYETEWGVCDEETFDQALVELGAAAREGPFLGFVLTLSNHRPFRVPEGRVEPVQDDDPRAAAMATAFRYADHALGRFMDAARREPWFRDTVFVLVADHGREPRPGEHLDAGSFHVPLLLYAPEHLEPRRVDTVTSQVDIVPTVLTLLGGEFEHCSFGGDALAEVPPDRAMMCFHDYLLWYEDDHIAVIPPDGAPQLYAFDGRQTTPLAETDDTRAELRRLVGKLRGTARAAFDLTRGGRFLAPEEIAEREK